MRVLHVLNGPAGGAANSTIEIAEEMDRRGTRSAAICHNVGSEFAKKQFVERFPGPVAFQSMYMWNRRIRHPGWQRMAIALRQTARSRLSIKSGLEVARFASEHDCDLIHSNTLLTPDGAFGAILRGTPHVWHARETVGEEAMQRFFSEDRAFVGAIAKTASGLVANSVFTAGTLSRLDGDLRVTVVRNAVDLWSLSRLRPFSPDAESSSFNIGMVGTVEAVWKRHDLFIEAAGLLRDDDRLRFTVFGAVPTRTSSSWSRFLRLKQLAHELGLGDRLQFESRFTSPEEVMANVDVVVQPTAIESFGRVVVEAMAAGRPVVAVCEGAAPEILADGSEGVLAPSDPVRIARAIREVVGDLPATAQRIDRARHRALGEFSISRLGEEMQSVYEDALTRPLPSEGRWGALRTIHLQRLRRMASSHASGS